MMVKKLILIALAIMTAFVPIEAMAQTPVEDTFNNLVLEAQHYYNTNVAYADMVITKVNEERYDILHYTQGGNYLTTRLYKTAWGTWNLGDMTYSSNSVTKTVIGGATDWEYVFRVENPINQNLEFTGGNHGNEAMRSFSMYDAVTGETFTLDVGESKYVNRLVVEENTCIKLGDVDYLNYADVKRVYTFVGKTVNLDCEITFTRDVKMSLSYTAMASVNKDFSRYCFFDNGMYVSTEPKGSVSNKYMGNVSATLCQMSGDDNTVKVNVGIYKPKDMTDNFSNRDKVFLWDMTEDFNKLYFSKYDMTRLTRVEAGTVWNFGTSWSVDAE